MKFVECSPFLRLRGDIMETKKKILREKRKIVKIGNSCSVIIIIIGEIRA